jgi:hypothetical protein
VVQFHPKGKTNHMKPTTRAQALLALATANSTDKIKLIAAFGIRVQAPFRADMIFCGYFIVNANFVVGIYDGNGEEEFNLLDRGAEEFNRCREASWFYRKLQDIRLELMVKDDESLGNGEDEPWTWSYAESEDFKGLPEMVPDYDPFADEGVTPAERDAAARQEEFNLYWD